METWDNYRDVALPLNQSRVLHTSDEIHEDIFEGFTVSY